jgi:NADPH:quinone reductase-like Zn-dependent oxidoreductase
VIASGGASGVTSGCVSDVVSSVFGLQTQVYNVNQLAMLGINPATVYLLLTEYVQLKPGEWLLQNAANSSVGRAVIAMAKARGR